MPLMYLILSQVSIACSFASSRLSPPNDATHRHLLVNLEKSEANEVLPFPIKMNGNAFVQADLQGTLEPLTGNKETLLENLNAFAASTSDDLCYWAFQGLPPPRGGPSVTHPFRGHWDVTDGEHDQDIEWVQAYGEIAVARLHSRIKKDGPVVGAMCAMGGAIAKRRCDNGKSIKSKCVPAITTHARIHWPMAVSIWKIGHPDLVAANTDWRASSSTGHLPNIDWVIGSFGGASAARPWSGAMPKRGEIDPPAMPHAPFPGSQGRSWGCPKIAKVVKCADIPTKYKYHTDVNYYCDHMPSSTNQTISSVDDAYLTWQSITSVWPPTKVCKDDQQALDNLLTSLKIPLVGKNCSAVYTELQAILPNFDCNNVDTQPLFRDVCCSECGGEPIPAVPAPAPSPPAPVATVRCAVCKHVYDPVRDGGGKAFADLPGTWTCPICGAPKTAYRQDDDGTWFHNEE